MIRLLEVLLHAGTQLSGWTTTHLHQVLLTQYRLAPDLYRVPQLRYDLRKLKAHGLLERHRQHYAYRLTGKGVRVASLFVLFHQRLCGPLAFSLFRHGPDSKLAPDSQLEVAYHRADAAIQNIIDLVQAA
jgi:hypothetical protein